MTIIALCTKNGPKTNKNFRVPWTEVSSEILSHSYESTLAHLIMFYLNSFFLFSGGETLYGTESKLLYCPGMRRKKNPMCPLCTTPTKRVLSF